MTLRLVMLGRTRRAEARALVEDYLARMSRFCDVALVEMPNSAAAARKLKPEPAAAWVLLDAGGRQFTSPEFAQWLAQHRARGTRELVFLCGDAEGFPEALRRRAQERISLSALTMPHELARVVLAEQLYRAFTILAGHPYPK